MKSVDLFEQFVSVRRSLGRAFTPYLQALDMGPKQLVVMRTIGQRRECSMSAIAEATASDMASVTRMVSALVASGWVDKQRDEGDRRQWRVRLSPKGLAQWENINAVVREVAATFASQLDEVEQGELARLLNKVQQGLDAATSLRTTNDSPSNSQTQE